MPQGLVVTPPGLAAYAEPGREQEAPFTPGTVVRRTDTLPVLKTYPRYQEYWSEFKSDSGRTGWVADKPFIPEDGEALEVFAEPGREHKGALAPGSSFEFSGSEQKDEDGLIWREVLGENEAGEQTRGWIPSDQKEQKVTSQSVVPAQGTKVYGDDNAETVIAALPGGSFVKTRGNPHATDDGRQMIEATGRTLDGEEITGLVDIRYLKENDTGVMGSTGRENPSHKSNPDFTPVVVTSGNTLSGLAVRYGVPYAQFEDTNKHLAEEYLQPGDIVYIPVTKKVAPDLIAF